jgi:hypothetical protein
MVTPADSNLDSEALCLVALGRRPAFLPVVDDRVSAFAQILSGPAHKNMVGHRIQGVMSAYEK